jgi:hypothetical protein
VRITPGYVHDFQLQSMMKTTAEFYADPGRRQNVEQYLARKFEDMDLPVRRSDVRIEDNEDTVRVWTEWTYEAVFIPQNEFVPPYSRFTTFHEEAIEKIKR